MSVATVEAQRARVEPQVLFDEIADVLDATRASGRPSKTMEEASMEG